MMKTKLKTMIGVLRPDMGKGNRLQPKFTLRKFFAMCLLAMVAHVGLAGDWNGTNNTMTYNFDEWRTRSITPVFQNGKQIKNSSGTLVSIVSDYNSANSATINSLDYRWAISGVISSEPAGESAKEWVYRIHNSNGEIYATSNQTLSLLNLFAGDKVQFYFWGDSNSDKWPEVTSTNTNKATGTRLESGQEVTMSSNGSMDFRIRNGIFITSVVITHTSSTPRVVFDHSRNSNSNSYSCRLSARDFDEPLVSVFPSGATVTYSVANEGGGDKAVAVMNDNPAYNGDVLFKNLGTCRVTATITNSGTSYSDSYTVWVWDNLANYATSENGTKYSFTEDGVVSNRTITAVGGVTMEIGNTNSNTAIVEKRSVGGSDRYLSLVYADNGWWDRYPYDAYAAPTQGTYYKFTARANGTLTFGGNKTSTGGKVIIVKESNVGNHIEIFSGSQSGYLTTANSSVYSSGFPLEVGETYYLHGTTPTVTSGTNSWDATYNDQWAVFELEWFKFETDFKIVEYSGSSTEVAYGIATECGASEVTTREVITVTGGGGVSVPSISCKGSIDGSSGNSPTVTINSDGTMTFSNIHYITSDDNMKGGAIKVTLQYGSSYKDFVLTIPYGNHVWDFRRSEDQDRQESNPQRKSEWHYSETGLVDMMTGLGSDDTPGGNGSDWTRVYKMATKVNGNWTVLKTPIISARSSINGNNAFYMDNTAGLVFVTGAESFGAGETYNSHQTYNSSTNEYNWNSGYTTNDAQYNLDYTTTKGADLVYMKGNATICFPGVKADQYIKLYFYRHSDDKGERFYARNLVDLDGKSYSGTDANNYFIMVGATDEFSSEYKGNGISGAAIFRVPHSYVQEPSESTGKTRDLSQIPSLTLCDDGWVKLYRIEIMDDYVPDLTMFKDISEENDTHVPNGFVAYDGVSSSVVLRKAADSATPTAVTNWYLAIPGNVRCQHGQTCKYEVIADDNVSVTSKIKRWVSNGGVNYNRLKLTFNSGNGFVRIIQREVANHNRISYNTDLDGNNEANTGAVASGDYVIDKNEYRIAVGELTVQNYPYTWDFTDYHMNKDNGWTGESKSTTYSAINGSSSDANYGKWTSGGSNSFTLSSSSTKKMGTNEVSATYVASTVADPKQELTIGVPTTAQGADLKAQTSTTVGGSTVIEATTISEGEGLGISLPYSGTKTKMINHGTNVTYNVYNTTSGGITLNGSNLSGAGTITIPEVDDGMYIFVKASAEPTSIVSNSLDGTTSTSLSKLTGNADIFGVQSGVYLYRNGNGSTSTKQDVVLTFASSTNVEIVAVTDIVKAIGPSGYATESRDHAIDHTYQDKLTTHPVRAYAIQTDGGGAYTYQDKFEVRKLGPVKVVPQKTGIVLHEDLESGASHSNFNSPLFYPAVNVTATRKASSEDADEDLDILDNNWMAPSIAWTTTKVDDVETVTGGDAADGVLFYQAGAFKTKSQTGLGSGEWCTKFILASTYYEYTKEDGAETGTISEGKGSVSTAGFYCFKYTNDVPYNTPNEENPNFLAGNKAFLLIQNVPTPLWNGGSGSSSSRGVLYIDLEELEGGNTTDINMPKNDNTLVTGVGNEVYYTLSGSRINGRPNAKGIYISNGKKVTIK